MKKDENQSHSHLLAHGPHKLPPSRAFFKRLLRNLAWGLAVLALSLAVGIMGYMHYENMSFLDAYMNAALILSGVGSTVDPKTGGGKVFLASYSLFSGIIFLMIAGILLSPIVHRLFHKFHLEDSNN